METALRHQLGADAVDIDTRASLCAFAFADPTRIDFDAIESAAADANYTLTDIHMTADGKVTSGFCKECGEDKSFFVLPSTEQRFELASQQAEGPFALQATVQNWNTGHPVLASD